MPLTLNEIEIMWNNNPDGAGIAIRHPKFIQIIKGLASPEEVFEILKGVTSEYFLHFRIGTHGSKADPRHTHPFPISDSVADMESLSIFCDSAMMHNGIMYKYGDEDAISDTMKFTRDFLTVLKLDHPKAPDMISKEIDGFNKVAIMMVNHPTYLCGKGWTKHEGRWYSNDGYMPSRWGSCDPRAWRYDDLEEIEEQTWMDLWKDGILENDHEMMLALFDEYKWIEASTLDPQMLHRKRKPKHITDRDWDVIITVREIRKMYEGVEIEAPHAG